MAAFKIESDFDPKGDQVKAIKDLTQADKDLIELNRAAS